MSWYPGKLIERFFKFHSQVAYEEELFKKALYFDKLPSAFEVKEVIRNLTTYNYTVFWNLINKYGIFQFWNKEYIECLSRNIKNLVESNLVLEVAAGDGMLSYWLRHYGVNIVATDSGAWYDRIKKHAEVEIIDAVSAIRKYKPSMVIASWLPYDDPVDLDVFNTSSQLNIRYIILIGETNGACGSRKFWEEEYWAKVGYVLNFLDECDRWNYCRTDYFSVGEIYKHSSTQLYMKVR